MSKNKSKIIKGAMLISILTIILLVIILISLWSAYIERQKEITSSAILSIVKLSIINSSEGDMDDTFSSIAEYIGDIPNKRIAIYDDKYNLRSIYPSQTDNFDIKGYPNLSDLLKSKDTGHETIHIDDYREEVFWDWIISSDGSRQLLIIYGMTFDSINEFSFVFIISYLLIIFILILVISIYLNDRYDYFISLSNLYQLSMRCDE